MKDFIRSFFSMFTSTTFLIPILIGLPFLGFGVNTLFETYRDVQVFVDVKGTVIDLIASTDEDGTSYAPVVRFTTRAGEKTFYYTNYYTSPPDFQIGDPVDMLYNPADASDARINTWHRLWALPLLLTAMGSLAIGVGLMSGLFGSDGPFNRERLKENRNREI